MREHQGRQVAISGWLCVCAHVCLSPGQGINALCSVVCSVDNVQVNGRLRCLGSTQHLKHRFGRGFEADIKLRRPSETESSELLRVMQDRGVGPVIGQGLEG